MRGKGGGTGKYLADKERVSGLERDELVQVEEDVEQGSRQLPVGLQVFESELPLHLWLDHVVHLAQHIHAVQLLLVEVLQEEGRTSDTYQRQRGLT